MLLALAALATPATSAPGAPTTRAIAPGVEAQIGIDEHGMRTVQELRIGLPRRRGETPPDLGPALTAAYDWCAGNVENGLEAEYKGWDTRHGCNIRVDTGVYRITQAAILRQTKRQRVPIEIDLGGSSILHIPDPVRSVSVRELAALPCNAAALGSTVNVEDPESLDAIDVADPEGRVEIARIGPNAGRTPGCPAGGVVCKYGAQAIRVETRTPHGLQDGGVLGLGDVVELSVPGTEYDGQRLLVKEVASPTTFLATPDQPPRESVSKGSVRETATTAWCNGASWRAGRPMIAIGGPGDSAMTQTTLRGGFFRFDGSLFRTTAVLVDGELGPDGVGGAGWVRIEGVSHTGNSSVRGQMLVALGTPHAERSFCHGVEVDASSDFMPPSWSPAVWNQSCNMARVRIRQHHGGGVWWGLDAPGLSGPTSGILEGYVEGCRDGPCLWVRSGKIVLADGFKAWGSVWGPSGEGSQQGPNAGRVAILGSERGFPVNVVAHGATWGAGQHSDLDCYVALGNVSHFVQSGGYLVSGDVRVGHGEEYLFCRAKGASAGDVTIEHAEVGAWSGEPRILRGAMR